MQILCDGCGQPASEEHFARRIRRLELATRFRPIHIQILFLAEAPPPRLENYFYSPNDNRDSRTGLSHVLFDELMRGLGIGPCLHQSLPVQFPHPANPAAQSAFRKGLAEVLARISTRVAES
jgi:hypothetical protein